MGFPGFLGRLDLEFGVYVRSLGRVGVSLFTFMRGSRLVCVGIRISGFSGSGYG